MAALLSTKFVSELKSGLLTNVDPRLPWTLTFDDEPKTLSVFPTTAPPLSLKNDDFPVPKIGFELLVVVISGTVVLNAKILFTPLPNTGAAVIPPVAGLLRLDPLTAVVVELIFRPAKNDSVVPKLVELLDVVQADTLTVVTGAAPSIADVTGLPNSEILLPLHETGTVLP